MRREYYLPGEEQVFQATKGKIGLLTFFDSRDFVYEGAGEHSFARDVENDVSDALDGAGHKVVRVREVVWTDR